MRAKVALGALAALCIFVAITIIFAVRSQMADRADRYIPGKASYYSGVKAEKYKGWTLADDELPDSADPRKARVMYYIMVAGFKELPGFGALLRTLYHRDHFFLVHLDAEAVANVRAEVRNQVENVIQEQGGGLQNVRMVEQPMLISWGGFSITLNAVYGIAQAFHWTSKWDYFINLSASDFPLLRADEIAGVLGEHKASNISFVKGFKYRPSWEGFRFVDRREMFAEDAGLFRDNEAQQLWPWAILDPDKQMLTRPMPNRFTVHKGEFWVILHRSMAEYVHKSPDNQARSLLSYFSGMIVSDEEFFQTVACNPHFPHETLRTHNDNLRFVNWWGDQASPAVIQPFRAVAAANSGALFGRKFSSSTQEGRDGIRWINEYLEDSSKAKSRVGRVKRRLASKMTPSGEPVGFCGLTQAINPPELMFAVEGDEEKLTSEFQPQPPRRGGGVDRDGNGDGDRDDGVVLDGAFSSPVAAAAAYDNSNVGSGGIVEEEKTRPDARGANDSPAAAAGQEVGPGEGVDVAAGEALRVRAEGADDGERRRSPPAEGVGHRSLSNGKGW